MSTENQTPTGDRSYRTTFDPSTDPCAAVAEAIEAVSGGSQVDQPVIAESIDPDTLIQLYRNDGTDSWMLSFDHAGMEITLWANGQIEIETTGMAKSAVSR